MSFFIRGLQSKSIEPRSKQKTMGEGAKRENDYRESANKKTLNKKTLARHFVS